MSGSIDTVVLLDPKWEVGVADFDGAQHVFVTLHHPTLGPIVSLVSRGVLDQLVGLLTNPGRPKPWLAS